ncbi:hypothetical protein G7Y79_00044g080170 [Physcia stellaris]|nr:hypothetical protein G7Y79_00044g080170 [Physcia stellaris]
MANLNVDVDFYALLNVRDDATQKELQRAWRLTALQLHPDKVGDDPVARDRFDLARTGFDILSDTTTRSAYDAVRTARLQKIRQNELFEGKRRQMKDDLEARERGFKRARTEEDEEEKLARELRRLAEDGKRRRREREAAIADSGTPKLRDGDLPHQPDHSKVNVDSQTAGPHSQKSGSGVQAGVSELDRTVKVRWPRDGPGESISQQQIIELFSIFGKVENAHLLNPKMIRMGKKNKKLLVSTCMVQYTSVVGAHEAVEDFPKQQGRDWSLFNSVTWAANKEPEFITGHQYPSSESGSAPSTPARNGPRTSGAAFLNMESKPSTPSTMNGDGLRKMPSFSSFSTPNGSPFGKSQGVNSPSLEEMTLIRLKNAEKKRLANEIQRQDEQAAAAEAAKT